MSARVISRGVALMPSRYGSGEGASVSQLPAASGWSSRSQPSWVEPLRPEWPSCRQSFARLLAWTKSTIRRQASRCASFQRPVQPGEMRPSGETQVISVNTSPAPPVARAPRCTRCQSFGRPSTAEYCAIGETTMRFSSVRPRSVSGRNIGGRGPGAPRALRSLASTSATKPGSRSFRFAWPMRWLPVSRL